MEQNESGKCSFSDCLHIGEPGCLVKADWERYPYYLQLLDEIKVREEFQLRTFGTKRESGMRYVQLVNINDVFIDILHCNFKFCTYSLTLKPLLYFCITLTCQLIIHNSLKCHGS